MQEVLEAIGKQAKQGGPTGDSLNILLCRRADSVQTWHMPVQTNVKSLTLPGLLLAWCHARPSAAKPARVEAK